jgi:hypothetical protein
LASNTTVARSVLTSTVTTRPDGSRFFGSTEITCPIPSLRETSSIGIGFIVHA